MTDLTLNEYRDISEDILKPLIKEEGRKMSGDDFSDKTTFEKTNFHSRLFSFLRKKLGK
jgi:hypothetical protein